MNVFSHDMLALAEEAFKKAEEDKDVKVVVITGNDKIGRASCRERV